MIHPISSSQECLVTLMAVIKPDTKPKVLTQTSFQNDAH